MMGFLMRKLILISLSFNLLIFGCKQKNQDLLSRVVSYKKKLNLNQDRNLFIINLDICSGYLETLKEITFENQNHADIVILTNHKKKLRILFHDLNNFYFDSIGYGYDLDLIENYPVLYLINENKVDSISFPPF